MPNSAFKQQYSSDRVGSTGQSGYSGYSGYSGISGYNQTVGTSGYSGCSGGAISGFSGYSAYSGTSGYSIRSGMVFSITGDYVEKTGSRSSGTNDVVITYELPDNSYSFIRVRACGSFQAQSNIKTEGNTTIVIGSSTSTLINYRSDATGSGDIPIKPWMIEYANQQTSATNIYLKIASTAGTMGWRVDSFIVEGII